MRNLNIIYTMHYFRCIWTSPDIMLLQNADDFLPSYVPIFFLSVNVEIVDLNFNIQLNYTYCQEEGCFMIHTTPFTKFKIQFFTLTRHLLDCH